MLIYFFHKYLILALDLRDPKMISLLKKLSLRNFIHCRPSFSFAQTSNVEFHKANLASKIILKISQSPLNDYRSKNFPSLKESILEIIDTYESKNTEQDEQLVKQAAKQVRNCFDDGVYVPTYVCNQNRNLENTEDYQDVKEQGVNIEILNIKEIDQSEMPMFRKLTFCPTYVITGQIFRKILRPERYRFLTGQYGVGKTYSFILYTLLSEMIFRYRHLHCSGNDDLPKEINFKIPKAVYISVNLDDTDSRKQKKEDNKQKEEIQKILRWHCYEFKNQLNNNNEEQSVISLSYNLNEKYRRKYKVSLTLLKDNINALAAAYRQFKFTKEFLAELYKRLNKFKKQPQNLGLQKVKTIPEMLTDIEKASADYQEAGLKLKKARKYIETLNDMIGSRIFGSLFYLSSVDIQQHVLGKLKLMGDSNQNNIGSLKDRLDYPTTLYGNIAIADTCELIALNLKQYWQKLWHQKNINARQQITSKQEEMLQIIKKTLNVIMRKQLFMLVLPLKISQFMRNKLDKQSVSKRNEETLSLSELAYDKVIKYTQYQMEKKLYTLMKRTQSLSIQAIVTKFTQFLDKPSGIQHIDEAKPRLCFQLWNLAYDFLKNHDINYEVEDETTNMAQASKISGLRGTQSIRIHGYEKFFEQINNNSAIFHQLFTYQNDCIVTQINPLIIRNILFTKRHSYYKHLLESRNPVFQYAKGNRSVLGSFLESSIITMLGYGGTSFQFTKMVQKKKLITQFKSIYRIVSCFKPILKKNMKNYSEFQFLDFIQKHCQTIAGQNTEPKRMTEWNLLLPLNILYHNRAPQIIQSGIKYYQVDKLSKLIDFALCIIDRRSNYVVIEAFDVTASKNQFLNKIQDFLVEFLNFKDKEKTSIQIENKEYEVKLSYNVITTEKFDNNFKKYFSKRIKSLQNNLTDQNQKKLTALKQFNFRNKDGECSLKIVSKKIFLKSIRVISLLQDEVKITNTDPDKPIELDYKMFERVLEQLNKEVSHQQIEQK